MLGFAVPQFSEVARWDLGDLPRFTSAAEQLGAASLCVAAGARVLAANGYPDAVVDLVFVATGTDFHLEWVERLLAP